MRLIDADAFIRFIKDVSKRQKYGEVLIDKNLTVEDVLNAVVGSLENKGLAEGDTPTIDAIPVKYIIEYLNKGGEDKINECLKEWEENG